MMSTWILIAALHCALLTQTALVNDEDLRAAAALEELERAFTQQPQASSEAALEALVARWPATPSAERARLWYGDLCLQSGHYADAYASYLAAERASRDARSKTLALRGRGSVAIETHAWSTAVRTLAAAALHADPVLKLELDQKLSFARRERARFLVEIFAWIVLVGVTLVFAERLRRATRRALPSASVYLVPVYALFLAAAYGHDTQVFRALAWTAVGSLALVSLGLARRDEAQRAERVAVAIAFSLANAALIYVAFRRAGLLEILSAMQRAGGSA